MSADQTVIEDRGNDQHRYSAVAAVNALRALRGCDGQEVLPEIVETRLFGEPQSVLGCRALLFSHDGKSILAPMACCATMTAITGKSICSSPVASRHCFFASTGDSGL